MDSLVFPAIFLYRQHLELLLKRIIDRGALLGLSNASPPATHDLMCLWGLAQRVIHEVWKTPSTESKTAVRVVDAVIREFHEEDPKSVAYRYAADRDGRKIHRANRHINLPRLRERIAPACTALDGCVTGLEEYVDNMADARADQP
jgi:ketosteroid isomerase-like protein